MPLPPQQNKAYLCVPTPFYQSKLATPAPRIRTPPIFHIPSFDNDLTPTRSSPPSDMRPICPTTASKLCTCQRAAAEKRAGIEKTFPRTKSNSGSMRLSDRDERGRIVEKGPRSCEEVVGKAGWGRKEYLMSLQEGGEVDGAVAMGGTHMGTPTESKESTVVDLKEMRTHSRADGGDLDGNTGCGQKEGRVRRPGRRKVLKRGRWGKVFGRIVGKICFAARR